MSDWSLLIEALVICSAMFIFWVVLGWAGSSLLSQLTQGIALALPVLPKL